MIQVNIEFFKTNKVGTSCGIGDNQNTALSSPQVIEFLESAEIDDIEIDFYHDDDQVVVVDRMRILCTMPMQNGYVLEYLVGANDGSLRFEDSFEQEDDYTWIEFESE